MKTVLKLIIAVALLNAMVRGAGAAWTYYQIRDAAERILLFGSSSASAQLKAQILATAVELAVPLEADGLVVRRQDNRRIAEGTYTQPIEFFPSYEYPVTMSFVVESVAVGAPEDEDVPPAR